MPVTEQQLYASRKEKTETDYKIKALRERETFKHEIVGGAYSGLLSMQR
jgi:hypothetical protein